MRHIARIGESPIVTTSRDGHITIKQHAGTWMLEDDDIVRFFEAENKVRWVIDTRSALRATGTPTPSLKGYMMAYEAIVRAIGEGQIKVVHTVTYTKVALTDPGYDRWFDTALNA
jgi:hypothetical protein